MLIRIAAPGPSDQGEIRLRFGSVVQHDRVGTRTLARLATTVTSSSLKASTISALARGNRRQVDHLPFEQFHPVVLTEGTSLAQATTIAPCQAMSGHRVTTQNVNLTRIHGPVFSGRPSRLLTP